MRGAWLLVSFWLGCVGDSTVMPPTDGGPDVGPDSTTKDGGVDAPVNGDASDAAMEAGNPCPYTGKDILDELPSCSGSVGVMACVVDGGGTYCVNGQTCNTLPTIQCGGNSGGVSECGGNPCCLDPSVSTTGACPSKDTMGSGNFVTQCKTSCALGTQQVCLTDKDCTGGLFCEKAVLYWTDGKTPIGTFGLCQ